MLPIYTQHLSPQDYGVMALIMFLISLLEIVFAGQMTQAANKYYFDGKSEEQQKQTISTTFIITALISATTAALAILLSTSSSTLLFDSDDYAPAVALFSTLICAYALENIALTYIRICQKPWLFLHANIAKLLLQVVLNIVFVVFMEKGVLGVALSAFISSLISATALSVYTLRKTGILFDKVIARKLIIYSWPLWFSGIAGVYLNASSRYFLNYFATLNDVGLFELAAKFGSIVLSLVWSPFSQFWQAEQFRIYKQANSAHTYRCVFNIVCVVLLIAALGISIFSPTIIHFMAAESFHSASTAVPYLAFAAVFQALTIYNNFVFHVKEKTLWISRNTYFTAALLTIFFIALIPPLGFTGAALATLLGTATQFFIVFFAARRLYDMTLKIKLLLISLATSSLIVYIQTYFQGKDPFSDFIYQSIFFTVGSSIVVTIYLCDSDTRQFLLPTLKKVFVRR